jgi:hypothetical protein
MGHDPADPLLVGGQVFTNVGAPVGDDAPSAVAFAGLPPQVHLVSSAPARTAPRHLVEEYP